MKVLKNPNNEVMLRIEMGLETYDTKRWWGTTEACEQGMDEKRS